MYDWVAELAPNQRILDIGSGAGSLRGFEIACQVIAIDSDVDAFANAYRSETTKHVFARGEALPFASESFDLVICHHVLEHIDGLSGTLTEISRVLTPTGRLFVSVPNGYGLCDGLYRFVFDGGEHVNRFTKDGLIQLLETSAGVRLESWQKLYSSFVYLSRLVDLLRDPPAGLSPRLKKLALLPRWSIHLFQRSLYLFTRIADYAGAPGLGVYGWALYLSRTPAAEVIERKPYINVCLACGAGHPADALQPLRQSWILYRCPACNRRSIYFPAYRGAL